MLVRIRFVNSVFCHGFDVYKYSYTKPFWIEEQRYRCNTVLTNMHVYSVQVCIVEHFFLMRKEYMPIHDLFINLCT